MGGSHKTCIRYISWQKGTELFDGMSFFYGKGCQPSIGNAFKTGWDNASVVVEVSVFRIVDFRRIWN